MPFDRPTGPMPNADGAMSAANATPDVHSSIASALHGAETSASAAAAKVSAEAAALSGKAVAAIGHAALAAGAAEPISPIIQMIMKMPGAMGLANQFFEILHNLFSGENLMQLFDPSLLQHAIGGHVAMLHNLATGAEHFTVSLAHMPGDAVSNSFNFHNLAGNGMMRLDSGAFNGVSAEHFATDPANVGAGADIQTAQFETGAGHVTTSEGALAGPAVTHGAQSNFLAGNSRLFSDKIGSFSGGNFNSMTSATHVPTGTANAIPNNSGATFGQDAVAQTPKFDGVNSGPAVGNESGSVLNKYGSDNVVASNDVGTYKPSTSNWGGSSDAGAGSVEPMRAQQLSFKDMQGSAPSKSVVDHIGHQAKGAFKSAAPSASSSKAMDSIGHTTLPKAYSSPVSHMGVNHVTPSAHHSFAHHFKPATHARIEQPIQQQQPVDANAGAGADQTQVAQATDGTAQPTDATAQPTDATGEHAYTVQKGDSLWNIAQKQFGDGSKWTEIYKMNQDVIGQNPDLIFQGTELKLPGADAMGQQVADAGQYTVKAGDNLWDIAQKQLGDGSKWGEIYKANADVIGQNPDLIQPGQHFQMPGASNEMMASAGGGAATNAAGGAAQAATQQVAQQVQMPMQQSAPGGFEQTVAQQPMAGQQPIMEQMPVQQAAPVQNYGGAAAAAEIAQPGQQVMQVQPQQSLPMGPGAAGAANEAPVNPVDAVVSSSIAPDLSWIKKQ